MIQTRRGFSLVELMVVVAIIGCLVALIRTSVRVFKIRALQAEVKTNLPHLKNLEDLYIEDNGKTVTFDDLGSWRIFFGHSPCPWLFPSQPLVYNCQRNPLGFSLTKCIDGTPSSGPGPRYSYLLAKYFGDDTRYILWAVADYRQYCNNFCEFWQYDSGPALWNPGSGQMRPVADPSLTCF